MKLFYILLTMILLSFQISLSKSQWVSQIPNGSVKSCINCHPSGNYSLNSFGKDTKKYLSGGKINWSEALAALDSDGDGFSNGVELQDPEGTWTTGSPAPGNKDLVTNPSDASDFPITNGISDRSSNTDFSILSISPNPVSNNSVIMLQIFNPGNLEIDLYNLNGIKIQRILDEFVFKGDLSFNLNELENLESGSYLLRFRQKNSILSKIIKIVK